MNILIAMTFPEFLEWYATLSRDGMALTSTRQAFAGRHNTIQRDVRRICARAGVPYLSPHKLRHGHVMWARSHARDMDELKAISQNIMHASVTITDGRYGNLVTEDVRNTIAQLGQSQPGDGLETKIDELLKLLRANSAPS